MSMTKEESARTLVESLNDGDLSALGLASSMDSSGDFETLANIQAELESMNAAEPELVTEDQEESVVMDEGNLSECILPDVEMTDVVPPEVESEQIVYTTASPLTVTSPSSEAQTKTTTTTLQRISVTKEEPSSQSQSLMILSPTGGGMGQIIKLSHPTTASTTQLQTLAQTLITAKTSEGNQVVHIRSAPTKTTTVGKPLTAAVAKPTLTEPAKKVYAASPKVGVQVVTSEQQQQQSPTQVLISTGPDNQRIKLLVNSTASKLAPSSPTKTITLDQAQQMGLIKPTKMPNIAPSSQKTAVSQSFKVLQTGQTGKYTLVQTSGIKSPTKILPAPPASKTVTLPAKSIQPNPHKVIIRQGQIKGGLVQSGNQIIRIPANRTIAPNQIHQIQVGGGQQAVQYMRVVSTPATGASNIVTVAKPRTAGAQQTTQGGQKINNSVVKVLPISTSNTGLRQVAPKAQMSRAPTQRLIIPASSGKSTVAIPASALSQLASGQAVLSTSDGGNLVVLPSSIVQQSDADVKPIIKSPSTPTLLSTSQNSSMSSLSRDTLAEMKQELKIQKAFNVDSNGIRPRKPCNCTKSQCLKLYCDCFANGEFCHMCNCNNCSNNLGNEEERQRAIKSCLERNPNAFRPKIGKARDVGEDVRRHNKGCNCKRSGCLKNYCECYEAKIPCSDNCKCIGCRNVEEPNLSQSSLSDLADAVEARSAQMSMNKSRMMQYSDPAFRPQATSNTGARQPFNFLTDKVVEMTCQCLLAQAEEAERNMMDEETSQKLIIEEFGRCLKEIIESAQKAEAT